MSFLMRRLAYTAPTLRGRAVLPRAPNTLRAYASTTKGDTENASNLGTPSPKPSDSPEEGDIKSSRATDGRPPETGGSVAEPVSQSNVNQSSASADEEGGDPVKNDPDKPAEQKKQETLKQGDTPLDAADK